MYFKCDTSGITIEQLTAITAVSTLFSEQSMTCTVTNINPITFDLKPQLSVQMRDRLLVNRVPHVIQGYVGKVEGNNFVIQKEAGADAPKRSRKRANKGDTDIRASEEVQVAE